MHILSFPTQNRRIRITERLLTITLAVLLLFTGFGAAADLPSSGPINPGIYTLTSDLELSGELSVPVGDVTIDLAGYTITAASGQRLINVTGTLTLNDTSTDKTGKLTGGSSKYGSAVYIKDSGTFTMNNGTITNCISTVAGEKTGRGGAVYADSSGTITLNNGTIKDCIAEGDGGGAVYLEGTSSSFTMNNGIIMNCTASNGNGGGVYEEDNCFFEMVSGEISNCSAKGNPDASDGRGGGVYTKEAFLFNGDAQIKNCTAVTGGGAYIKTGQIAVRGSPKIIDNKNTTQAVSNLYLTDNTNSLYLIGAFTGKIGITVKDKSPAVNEQFGTYSGEDVSSAKNFISDENPLYFGLAKNDKLVWGMSYATPVAEIVGGKQYNSVESAFSEVLPGQTIRILADSTLNDVITISDETDCKNSTTLDLNGYTLTATQNTLLFSISSGKSLNLTDSTGRGSLKGNGPVSGGGGCVAVQGVFNMTGATITDGISTQCGGGVVVSYGGIFTMNSGNITNCTASEGGLGGGGVFIGNGAAFYLNSGRISECSTEGETNIGGGGVCLWNYSQSEMPEPVFYMTGGTIVNCTSESVGGGVANLWANFTMTGGKITDCKVPNYGGGLYQWGNFTISGSPEITGNTLTDGNASNVFYYNYPGFIHNIIIIKAALTGGKIGLAPQSLEGQSLEGTFTSGWNTFMSGQNPADYFLSDNADYYVTTRNGEGYLEPFAAEIVDGEKYETVNMAFKAVSPNKIIRLLADSNMTSEIEIGSLNAQNSTTLDLNGFTLTAAKDARLFTIDSGYFLNLTDSTGSGALKGNGTVSENGGGVNISGIFNMASGRITDCNTSQNGGGIYISGYGEFNITGGVIANCQASESGSGVYAENGAVFAVSGSPEIFGNTNSGRTSSSNVYLQTNQTLNLTGAFTGGNVGISFAGDVPAIGLTFGNVTNSAGISGGKFSADNDAALFGIITGSTLVWDKSKPAPTPQPKATERHYSSGSSSNSGAGNYNYYPRTADGQAGTISFGTSKTVKSVTLPAGVTGEVTLVAKSSVPAPSNYNTYNVFEINIPTYPSGKEAVVEFDIPLNTLAKAGKTPGDVSLLHGDGVNWDAATLPTTFTVDGDNAVYHSTTTSFSPFAIVYVDGSAKAETPEAEAAVVSAYEPAKNEAEVLPSAEKTAMPTSVPSAAATATPAAKTPFATVGVLAGLAAGLVFGLGRRE